MNLLKYVNLALSFALELCALAAFGMWGYQAGQSAPFNVVLAVAIPLVAAVVWGVFESPRALWPLPEPWHLLFALVFFALACLAFYATGHSWLASTMALLVAINKILAYLWGQESSQKPLPRT